ncbi:MAG: hypothetical protein K6G00_03385 [Treponema sp.]|nr:hypothetical protein [Treponema sp.]
MKKLYKTLVMTALLAQALIFTTFAQKAASEKDVTGTWAGTDKGQSVTIILNEDKSVGGSFYKNFTDNGVKVIWSLSEEKLEKKYADATGLASASVVTIRIIDSRIAGGEGLLMYVVTPENGKFIMLPYGAKINNESVVGENATAIYAAKMKKRN